MFPSDEGNSVEGVKRHTGSTPENSYQQGSEVGRRGLTVTHRQTHGGGQMYWWSPGNRP